MNQPRTLAEVPKTITIDGREHLVLGTKENVHYRALVLPVNGGAPRWLSNDEVEQYTKGLPADDDDRCPTCGEDGGTSCGLPNCGLLG